MNFDLSETQELFRSTTERFTQKVDVALRTSIRSEANGYDRTRWVELCELGLLAVAATEDQGGLEGSQIDLSIIAETMGSNNAVDPWLENGLLPILLLSKAERTDLLEPLIEGTNIAAVAFAEPGTRYELAPATTKATKTDSGYSLIGQKQFIMGGALADMLLVTASYNDSFALFYVPADSEGIETRTYRLADGSIASEINLNDVNVSDVTLVNLSFEQYQSVVTEVCMFCCSEMLGLSQLLLDETLAYVKDRKQFDVAIGSFQVIQHGLVDCYSELEQMRSLLYRTLLMDSDSSENWHANVMGAKSFISDSARFIAEQAVQYHGAMGTTDEVAIGHALKRIILLSRLFGDSADNLKEYMNKI